MRSVDDGYSPAAHSFSPDRVAITRNGTVTWTNETGVAHNVTFASAGAPPNVPDHGSGSSTRAFPASGTFAYACTNHPGMQGEVVVQ